MAISVTSNYEYLGQTVQGVFIRRAKLTVTGLVASSANVVPHDLPSAPLNMVIEPTSSGGFHETQPPDAANIYLTADGVGTSCNLYIEY